MRLSFEHLTEILETMTIVAWTGLGHLYQRVPLARSIDGKAAHVLLHLQLAEPVGRQNLQYGVTALGTHIWEHHRPEEHR